MLTLAVAFSLPEVPAFASDQTSTDLADYTIYIENTSGYDRPEFALEVNEFIAFDDMDIELRCGEEVLSSDKYDLEVYAYFNDGFKEYYDQIEDTGRLNSDCNTRYVQIIGQTAHFCDFIVVAKARAGSGYTGETDRKQGFRVYHPHTLDYDVPTIEFKSGEISVGSRIANYDSWHACYQIPTDQAANVSVVVKDHDGNVVVQGISCSLTYYKWNEHYDSLGPFDAFPTENGHYFVQVEGVNDYRGKTFVDFYIGTRLEESMFELGPAVYNGKEQKPAVKTDLTDSDYSVTYTNNVNAGTGTATFTGKGNYTGTVTKTFKIAKAANKLTLKPKTAKIKYKKLKKKAQTIKRAKMMTVSKKYGKVTYQLTGVKKGNKKIKLGKAKKDFKISPATGDIKLKKGLKKGVYKVTVKVTAAGGKNYTSATKTVTFKIKVE